MSRPTSRQAALIPGKSGDIVAACTLALSPLRAPAIRRLQPFRHLHDCSGCFRLERWPGGTCTHWKSAALARRTPLPTLVTLLTCLDRPLSNHRDGVNPNSASARRHLENKMLSGMAITPKACRAIARYHRLVVWLTPSLGPDTRSRKNSRNCTA